MPKKHLKFKRQDLKNLVEAEYGIRVLEMHEIDRGILLYTGSGIKLLKKCKRDEAKIVFAAHAYEHIRSKGFDNISCINRTQSGGFQVSYESQPYMLQDFTTGKIFAIKTVEDAERAGELLARLHKAAVGFVPPPGCHARVDWGKWMEKFKSYAFNIKRYREAVEQKGANSKLDKLFIKNVDTHYDRMYRAYLIMKNFGYLDKVQQSMQLNQLAHKQFRKHSIICSEKDELFVCAMEDCAYDIPEIDLADLLESFSGSKRLELTKAALQGYSKVSCIDRKTIKIIQAFLLQPKRFYKVVDKCYGRKKNYTESELSNKLEKSIKKEVRKDCLIEFLENL